VTTRSEFIGTLAHVMGEIENVPKNGYNSFHKYNYDLIKAIRPKLAEAGIMLISSVTNHDIRDAGDSILTILSIQYTITDGENEIHFQGIGYGSDKGDKGAYKAMTGALKYALMKTFLVDTGDDPEGDTKTDERAARPPVVQRATLPHAERGGYSAVATPAQIRTFLETTVTDMGLDREQVVGYIEEKLGKAPDWSDSMEDDEQRGAIVKFLRTLPSAEMQVLLDGLPK
jgi:hypothetical protein